MKKLMSLGILMAAVLMMVGCTSTNIKEFDKDGKLVKETQTSSDIAGTIVASTKDKTVIMWKDGWAAYLQVTPGTYSDPTPNFKAFGGQVNEGYIGVLAAHKLDWSWLASIISATSKSITVNPTTGIGSAQNINGKTETKDVATPTTAEPAGGNLDPVK